MIHISDAMNDSSYDKSFISSSMNVKTWIELQLQGWQHGAIKGNQVRNEKILQKLESQYFGHLFNPFLPH